ncbi:MAG: NAD(P)/FAD-dependent oxidoreductase [Microvirga sp.]
MTTRYDLAIAGAGPAGSVPGYLAARAGLRVLVAERSHFDGPKPGETAPPELRPLLARVGLSHVLDESTHTEAPAVVSVWGNAQPAERPHILSPFGNGFHLDRRAFDERLAQAAGQAGARCVSRQAFVLSEGSAAAMQSSRGVGSACKPALRLWR